MRYKSALLPTLKEAPSDATAKSHSLLLRAGFMRQVGAGLYSYLPLGLRVLRKIEAIVREEMDRAGAQEILFPALLPADYFRETGRWDLFGDTLLRLKDRKGGDYLLGPTHEELVTDLARREIQSYRDLPKNLYQVQAKYRDEPRPRGGLLRGREFLMKDAYSFDADEEGAEKSFEQMRSTYCRIFDRIGFDYRMVGADSGAMGGSRSVEFQVLVQSGEDFLAACTKCDYAENLEVAAVPVKELATLPTIPERNLVETPGKKTIEEVSTFMKASPDRFLKSLVYVVGEELILAVVRGDHEVNEIKLARALGAREVHLASPEAVGKALKAKIGYIGPVEFPGKVLVDPDAVAVVDAITGANKTGFHVEHVQYGRDYQGEVVSLRSMAAGDACPKCGAEVGIYRGIEAGHIFILGTHYSQKMGATFLDNQGEAKTLVMGCYGIGISRLVASVIEQTHDEEGLVWPVSVAPYPVHICQLGEGDEVNAAVEKIEKELTLAGYEPLVDDRDIRPGVKFKDADLIGIPFRITVGDRGLKDGVVELKPRTEKDPKAAESIPLADISRVLIERIQKELSTN
jgi:prolyl-tRNA synthetase